MLEDFEKANENPDFYFRVLSHHRNIMEATELIYNFAGIKFIKQKK